MENLKPLPINLAKDLIAVTKRLADAVEFDVNGSMGRGGNGGLVSDEAIRAAGEAKRILSRIEVG